MSDSWLDEVAPLEPEESAAQIEALLEVLGQFGSTEGPRRVLDLGCGAGRVLVPLAAAGYAVTGLDRHRGRLDMCRDALADAGVDAVLVETDFAAAWPGDLGVFDAVICLGNTMMTVVDMPAALALLRAAANRLAPGGLFVIDDFPQRFWPELTEGNWQSGLSSDGQWQMVWDPADAVFTIRAGERVDPDAWELRPGDTIYRLWGTGALSLIADLAGLSGSGAPLGEGLLIMRRPES